MINWYRDICIAGSHKFACVLAPITGRTTLREKIFRFGQTYIADSDLADDGRDDNPHITVLYGLHSNDPSDAYAIIHRLKPLRIRLGKISAFDSHPDYDVIKIDVESYDMRLANIMLRMLSHTMTHPEYNPHLTLAYVKKGHCRDLIGSDVFENITDILDKVEFSTTDDEHIVIELSGRRG